MYTLLSSHRPTCCHLCGTELCEIHFELLAPVARGEHGQPRVDLRGIDPVRHMGRVLHGMRLPSIDSAYEDGYVTDDIDDLYKPTTDG